MSAGQAASGLVRSSHPLPCAAVTAIAVVLAAAAGNRLGTCVLLGAAVLTGQLTVGWSNDRFDLVRDRRVGHPGKPLVAGDLSPALVDAALAGACLATVALSLLLGWRAGALHLAALAAAWAYNAWLKATVWSWLPYAFAFGSLPAVATLALPAPAWPAWWIVGAAALLGAAINFGNALPAMAAQPGSDVAGLPDRLGAQPSLLVAAALVLTTAAGTVWLPPGAPRIATITGGALAAALTGAGVPLLWRRAAGRQPFYALFPVVTVLLITIVVTARPLH